MVMVPDRLPVLGLLRSVGRELATGCYDILHSHGFTAGAIASVANLPFSRPHLLTSHDVFLPEHFPDSYGRWKARALSWLIGRADIVQSVTHDAQANLLAYLPGLRRHGGLAVLLNGVDPVPATVATSEDRKAWRANHAIPQSAVVLGFIGRLMPQKGFEYLIDAIDRLKDQYGPDKLIIAVAGDGGFIRERRAEIVSRGIESWFRFLGFQRDVQLVLEQVDSVVMPSLWEACGLVAMEALISGRPLIASRCEGLREVTAGSPAVSIAARDAAALAGAIRQMIEQHQQLAAATARYVPVALERFDAQRTADGLQELFAKATARHRCPTTNQA
jgi:glycosyltransferase involved in cell wall biosynthesis